MTEAEVLALPKRMLERMQYVHRFATALQSAWELWDVHLRPADRESLGGDFETAWRDGGTFGLWMKARSASFERAVLDVGFKLGFLAPGEYETFLERIRGHRNENDELHHLDLARYQLIITETPRRVFWQGTELPVDWKKQNAAWCSQSDQ